MIVLPDCPKCSSNRAVYEDGDRKLWCTNCKVSFDNDPTEGGDYFNNPTKRIEVQEAWEAAKTADKGRRRGRSSHGCHRRHSRRVSHF